MNPLFETSAPKYDWINCVIAIGVGHRLPTTARYTASSRFSNSRSGLQIFNTETAMAELTSFQKDIRPLFTERDIRAMSKALNLASYDDVKANAAVIYDRIRGIGGAVMPPPPPRGEGPWPQARIELFGKWMTDGYRP